MNLDDESYLSAFLDGELDPADRLAVEWSIESSPPLSERLRQLALARDAVDGLPRPAIPRDLAPDLVARISAARRKARLRSFAGPARAALAISAVFAVAACMMVATVLLFRATHDTPNGTGSNPPAVADQLANPNPTMPRPITDLASRTHPVESFASSNLATPPSNLGLVGSVAMPSTSKRPRSEPPAPPGEARVLGDRRAVARMLERPRVRRIVIVTDIIETPDIVQKLIQEDARKTPEYARITICQDIIIDADRVEPAEVFAVPMDERVHRSFVDRLRGKFPGLVEEGESSPELVTQLSEVGRVAVFRGTEAAPLGEPPGEFRPFVATRTDPAAPPIVTPHLRGFDREDPRVERGPSVPSTDPGDARDRPGFVGPPDPDRLAEGPEGTMTVLVWVTRPPRL